MTFARRSPCELDRKFKGAASPELLHLLDSVGTGVWAAYAYLFEELPFEWAFKRMRRGLEFAGREVENFGIWQFLEEVEEMKAERQARCSSTTIKTMMTSSSS